MRWRKPLTGKQGNKGELCWLGFVFSRGTATALTAAWHSDAGLGLRNHTV
jgi:hypothetical protein